MIQILESSSVSAIVFFMAMGLLFKFIFDFKRGKTLSPFAPLLLGLLLSFREILRQISGVEPASLADHLVRYGSWLVIAAGLAYLVIMLVIHREGE